MTLDYKQKRLVKNSGEGVARLIVLIILGIIVIALDIVLLVLFISAFIIKILFRLYKKFISKKQVLSIFALTKFERKLTTSMINNHKMFSKGKDKFNPIDIPQPRSARHHCIICGNPLHTRRKYCSKCRPTYSSVPITDY